MKNICKKITSVLLCALILSSLIIISSAESNDKYDFSEINVSTNTSYWDSNGFINAMGFGGNSLLATSYFTRWAGPVYETDDPFPESGEIEDIVYRKLNAAFHVQNITFIQPRSGPLDNDDIKKAIMNYGALYITFLVNTDCFSKDEKSYYMPPSSLRIDGGHAVAVVGWDDNYSRKNFKVRPKGDGAFICKNSWGDEWGDNGYFYISYYDKYLSKTDVAAAFYGVESNDNYDKIYQYDPLGAIADIESEQNTAYQANVFPPEGSSLEKTEQLCAVSFYTDLKGTGYEIYVASDYKNEDSLNDAQLVASGIMPYAGYHTVDFNAVTVKKGTRFAVIVKLTNRASNGISVKIETPILFISDFARANPGESFYRFSDTEWRDVTDEFKNTNVCVKAFTKTADDSVYEPQAAIDNEVRKYISSKTYSVNEILKIGGGLNSQFVEAVNDGNYFDEDNEVKIPSVLLAKPLAAENKQEVSLPDKYDLRDTGCVSGVKDQMYTGTCWAFAATASVESCMLKKDVGLTNLVGSTVHSVKANDMRVNYKKHFTPDIKVIADPGNDYTVTYSSSDPSVISVDGNGQLYSAKTGSAVITATVTDYDGNSISDKFTVKSKYSFGQWLIRIFMFGFLWY